MNSSFQVLVNGTRVRVLLDGSEKELGFVVTRVVEASSAESAAEESIRQVIDMVRSSEGIQNSSEAISGLKVLEITSLIDVTGYSNTGFVFYEDQ